MPLALISGTTHRKSDRDSHTRLVHAPNRSPTHARDKCMCLFPAKPLQAYLDEMRFPFNNRKNPYLFRDTIIKLIQTSNLEYKELTAKVQEAA